MRATFTVFWLDIAFIAVHSGERCGPWASGLFARKSILVPTVKADLKEKKFLCHMDVQCIENILIVSMRWSKTIQFGERVLQTLLIAIPGSILCSVTAYKNICSAIKAISEGPLFKLSRNNCIFINNTRQS